MTCPLCNDSGEQRYWEGRWRDERAENDRLRAQIAYLYTIPENHPYHTVWKEVLKLRAINAELVDALENLTIGIGMGWDLDGMVAVARATLAKAGGEA